MEEEKFREKLGKAVLDSIDSGKLNTPDYNANFNPIAVNVLSYSKPEHHHEFFDSLEQAKPALDFAMKGIADLINGYLSNAKYEAKRDLDVIEVELPTKEKDFFTPKLDSFYNDQRIIVKPVKQYGLGMIVEAEISYAEGFQYKSNFSIFDQTMNKLNRGYIFRLNDEEDKEELERIIEDGGEIPKFSINVQRLPIIFNASMVKDKVNGYSNLAYYVLSQQLEPYTTFNLIGKIKNHHDEEGNISPEFWEELQHQKMHEEDLVCNAIIRGWMHKKGFTGDEVFMQGPEDIPEKQRYNAFKQVQMAGPEKVIDYYGDDEWDLENFLDGGWRL